MIEIKNKEKCCGCSACANICPKKCISLKSDEEGFLYPVVNKDECINCKLCEKICPILNKKKYETESENCFAVYNKDDKIRKDSTSGGFFTALSEKIIDLNGIVFGAAFDDEFNVKHTKVNIKEDLYKLRGSKYVQSCIGNSYIDAKNLLENDNYVLFAGTPCQIYGLKAFLGKEYKKLYCVDVICKGVPSPGLWDKYKKDKQRKNKIEKICFREKTYGFNSTTMSIYYSNGKEYHKGHESDEMLDLFVSEISSRPSCYKCNFKGMERASDYTIGDCWKASKMVPTIDDEKGTTLVIAHTEKAKKLLEKIENIQTYNIDMTEALKLNGGKNKSMYLISAEPNDMRKEFYTDYKKLDYKKLMKKYCPKTIKTKIKSIAKPMLYKLGILNKLKNAKKG